LFLPAGEADAPFANDSVKAFGKFFDELVGVGYLASDCHFFPGYIGLTIAQILGDSFVKKMTILHDQTGNPMKKIIR